MARAFPRRLVLLGAVLAVVLLMAGVPTEARKAGVSGRAEGGCTCHGGGAADASILASLEGVPAQYEPGKVYPLTLGLSGGPPYSKAGFNLNASKGQLSVPGGESNVQITTKDTFGGIAGEATHKSTGTRSWKVDWAGPPAGSGRITFRLATNSVNGNDQADLLDKWSLLTKSSDEKNLAPKAVKIEALRQVGPSRANVSWSGIVDPDVVRLEIHRGTKPGFPMTAASKVSELKTPKATSVDVDKLAPNTTYYFRIRAVDKGGLTADSTEASVRIEAGFHDAAASPSAEARGSAPVAGLGPATAAVLGVAAVVRASRRSRDDNGRRSRGSQ